MISLILAACGAFEDTGDYIMPVENISCSHPDSRFEGVVEVEVEDDLKWENVFFEIIQGEIRWETTLQTEDGFIWTTRMQLYELDCYNQVNYEVTYGSR